MPYGSVKQAKEAGFPTKVDGAPLALEQINRLASMYDAIKAGGAADQPMAVAIEQFKKLYQKTDTGWVVRAKAEEGALYSLSPAEIEEARESQNEVRFYESADVMTGEWVEIGEATVEEGVDGGPPRLAITVIREGFSKNVHTQTRRKAYKRFYPKGTLVEAAANVPPRGWPVYLGKRGHEERPAFEDRMGAPLANVRFAEDARGRIVGDFIVYEDKRWVLDRIKADPGCLGPSIEANGRVRLGRVGGTDAAVVEALAIDRILLVEHPAAGGTIDGVTESENDNGGEEHVKDLTLTQLREDFPDVFAAAREEILRERQTSAEVKAQADELTKLREEVKTLKADREKAVVQIREAAVATMLEAALPKDKAGKPELPEISRKRVAADVAAKMAAAKITEAEDARFEKDAKDVIAEAVKAEVDYVTELTKAGSPKGAGAKEGAAADASFTEAENAMEDLAGISPDEEAKGNDKDKK
jgi:hypothetical protein